MRLHKAEKMIFLIFVVDAVGAGVTLPGRHRILGIGLVAGRHRILGIDHEVGRGVGVDDVAVTNVHILALHPSILLYLVLPASVDDQVLQVI